MKNTYVAIDLHYGSACIWQKVSPIDNGDGTFSMNPVLKDHPFFSMVEENFKKQQENGVILLLNSVGGYNMGYNKENVLVEFQADSFPHDYPEFTDEDYANLTKYLKTLEVDMLCV